MKQELNHRSIKQLLDKSSASLTPEAEEKLRLARMHALAHQKAHRTAPALAWIGQHGQHDHHAARRTQWVAALLLVACVLGAATYWQSSGNDVSDIDIAILTDDLPVHAYVE